jgi:glycosyltransferase involved in cell wall biosynthesis
MRRRYRALLEGARLLVACSAFQKERFIRNTGLRSLDGKIAVVRNGVDPRLFHHEPGNVRAELGIDPGKTLLLSVSRVAKGKGFDTKYDLFRRLLARDPGFHWIVIGQGDYLGELRRLVRAGGLEGSVTLLGGIPRDRLRRWYSSCDVFWLLSELEESFGLVYAEAALCGTPSIGYAAAGAREAIMDGTTGFLVRTGEDALEILEKRSFSALSRQDIARRAQAFSSDAMQSLWLHELHRVLAARSGGQ